MDEISFIEEAIQESTVIDTSEVNESQIIEEVYQESTLNDTSEIRK